MEVKENPMPGYKINEYQLVVRPHESLWNKINQIKEDLSEKYKLPLSRYMKPHICLVNFVTWDMLEEKILLRLEMISSGIAPFKVELHDYGSYPSHTIFIRVSTKIPFQNLVRQIKPVQRLLKLNQEYKPHFFEEPHIAIARKLKPWQYEEGWNEFAQRHFTGKFITNGMLLLKRPAETKTAFQILKRFEFMNLPVTTRQGDLFF